MNQQGTTSSQNFPIDNVVYDLMMVIAQKSKGLKAMQQYMQDAQNNQRIRESFEKIRRQDEECVRELTQHLSFLIGQQQQQQQAAGPGAGRSATGGASNR